MCDAFPLAWRCSLGGRHLGICRQSIAVVAFRPVHSDAKATNGLAAAAWNESGNPWEEFCRQRLTQSAHSIGSHCMHGNLKTKHSAAFRTCMPTIQAKRISAFLGMCSLCLYVRVTTYTVLFQRLKAEQAWTTLHLIIQVCHTRMMYVAILKS